MAMLLKAEWEHGKLIFYIKQQEIICTERKSFSLLVGLL